jgi:hypothetical protein
MSYVSNETGRNQVWVRAFPGPGEKYSISPGNGENPVWARDQRELFYLTRKAPGKQGVMAVDIASGTAFKYSQPHQLFEGPYEATNPVRSYDITADGQHFILLRIVAEPAQPVTKLTVVLNFFDELRRRVPASK